MFASCHPAEVNEHQLQKHLTELWVDEGAVIAGERLFLAAWEVMDNYRINSAQRGFGRPAIDFLLLDSKGCMVALELKLAVRSPRDSWSVLCQVTHRAQRLAEEFTPALLESAYRDSHSGAYGRIEAHRDVGTLTEAHARFFDTTPLPALPGMPVRRVVAATHFGPAWGGIREAFVEGPREATVEAVSRYAPGGGAGREFRRWLELAPVAPSSLLAIGVLDWVVRPPQMPEAP